MTIEYNGNIVKNLNFGMINEFWISFHLNIPIEGFNRINRVLISQDRVISDVGRMTLLRMLECYANDISWELIL